ncbi:hypothetical protein MTBBW1_410042 [Desulfamplus magnetovallimortis]|uniref:Uncharacterized protein n=1 Tax=Desulfamplus magnetovallimortis TaxID=1246637 RepID=A0A1W1HGR6_9BACT|nr:hypothetical protein MTBBW1_410042 [Desulfamplus magnetovallimortis]
MPNLPSVSDVLPCGCDHHFTGKKYPGRRLLGVGANRMKEKIKKSIWLRNESEIT